MLLSAFNVMFGKPDVVSKSSVSCARAFLAIVWKAMSTLIPSFADVSKYGISFFDWHHCWARLVDT